jgi:rod shape-determining protein MreC
MFKLLSENKFFVTLGLLILLPIIAINTSKKNRNDLSFFDKAINFIALPIQETISNIVDVTAKSAQNYLAIVHLRQEYLKVIEQNRKLNNIIHELKEIEAENKRLRALLDFQKNLDLQTTSAQVIAQDVSIEFKSIRINKGAKHGLQKGMAVVTHEGVVGKILKVYPNASDVITILDELFGVDAIVQRSRAHGVLEGSTDNYCLLKNTLRTDDINEGDSIVTSGLDQIFPKGILLGTVIEVKKKSYGTTQIIKVKPSVNFKQLEEVLVILKPDTYTI